jgi:hypothetical protein
MTLFENWIKPSLYSVGSVLILDITKYKDTVTFVIQTVIGILTIVYFIYRIKKIKNEQKNDAIH